MVNLKAVRAPLPHARSFCDQAGLGALAGGPGGGKCQISTAEG